MGFVDRRLAARVAFEVTKLHLGLVIGEDVRLFVIRLAAECIERLLLPVEVGLRALQNAAGFILHRGFQRRALRARGNEPRMSLAIGKLHGADLLLQGVILLAQIGHVRRLEHRGAGGLALGNSRAHLPVTRFRLDEALLTVEDLCVELARKLVADELAIGGLQAVVAPEILDPLLRFGDVAPQLIESFIQVLRYPAGALGGRLEEFRLESLDDRVREGDCLGRFLAPHLQDHDEGAFLPARLDPLGQGAHRRWFLVRLGVPRGDERLQPVEQCRPDEFGVVRKPHLADDALEDVARGQYPELAFDFQQLRVALRIGRKDVVADDVEIGRVHDEVGIDRVSRRRRHRIGEGGGNRKDEREHDPAGAVTQPPDEVIDPDAAQEVELREEIRDGEGCFSRARA